MKTLHHYFNFPSNSEEAFNFYRQVFGGEFMGVFRFRDMGGNEMGLPEEDLDRIMHIALPVGNGDLLMGTDALKSMGQSANFGNNHYVFIETDSAEEATRLFAKLSEGGSIEMPLEKTEWAEKYGACRDRFQVQWMVNYTGDVQFGGGSGD